MGNFEHIIKKQRKYFLQNKTKDIRFRKEQLIKLYKILKANEKHLSSCIKKDFFKSDFETYITELSLLYGEIKYALEKLYHWAKPESVSTNITNLPGSSYIISEPLGVTLIIGAWNYPYQLSLSPMIAAMAAGNTVILKPSELPSETSKAMSKIISENFDESYITTVQGGVKETTELLKERFDKIFFTGSTQVGKIVYEAAAKNLTPVALELGGKSPTIVTADADLEVAARRISWAKFLNSGQTCIAPDYVLVEESVKEKLLKLLQKNIEKSKYQFSNQNYVQIISERHTQRLIDLTKDESIYYGGKFDLKDRYFQPTLLDKVNFDSPIMQEEIFGPILPIISYSNVSEIIDYIKQQEKPLALYLFTKNNKIKKRFLDEVSFGGGCINDALMHISNHNLPFGGVGHSGMGNYHGKHGFDCFSHKKSILERSNYLEPSIKYPPYTKKKMQIIKKIQ